MDREFSFIVWKIKITIAPKLDLFDLDPSDGAIGIGLGLKIYFTLI
jgi:hypothetical protein